MKNVDGEMILEKVGEKLYAFRGIILGIFSLALLLFPFGGKLSWSGIALIFLGGVVRVAARREIGAHSRTKKLSANRLVREGIYSKIRHPLYVSNGLSASGFALAYLGARLPALLLILILYIFLFCLMKIEDRFLHLEFGREWEDFAQKTPMIFPKISSKKNPRGHVRSAWSAFCADRSTWFFWALLSLLLFGRSQIEIPVLG